MYMFCVRGTHTLGVYSHAPPLPGADITSHQLMKVPKK